MALCIADRLKPPYSTRRSKLVRIGCIYTVTSVRWSNSEQCFAIGLEGAKSKGPLGQFHAGCFRKITPGADIEGVEERRRVPVREDA